MSFAATLRLEVEEEGKAAGGMGRSAAVRARVEAALAERVPGALTPQPQMVRPVLATGVAAVDELLGGGLPVGAVTEIVGAECSGRTGLALRFVAEATAAGKVCAWVDGTDALSPESAAGCGVDLASLLWVRCGVVRELPSPPASQKRDVGHQGFAVPQRYFVAKPAVKGLHGGGMGGHPRGEAKGMEQAVSGLLENGVSAPRTEVRLGIPERNEKRRHGVVEAGAGDANGKRQVAGAEAERDLVGIFAGTEVPAYPEANSKVRRQRGRPWGRMEQALKAMDLLLAAGGFAVVVLDLAGIGPEEVTRIPLATWFRYRAAAERTQACVVLLTQHACAKSAAGMVLRMGSGTAMSAGGTVLAGFERRVEVVRRRFAEEPVAGEQEGREERQKHVAGAKAPSGLVGRVAGTEMPAYPNVVAMKKPAQSERVWARSAAWKSGMAWAGRYCREKQIPPLRCGMTAE